MTTSRPRLYLGILTAVLLLPTLPLSAQSCQLKTGIIALGCSAGAELYIESPFSDCYDAMRVILEEGRFYQPQANTAGGWIVEELAPNELLLTHTNGFFPMGNHLALQFRYYRTGGLDDNLILLYDDQCALEGCAAEYILPGCGEGRLDGTVYRECNGLALTNQPGLENISIQLWDDNGNFLAETLSGPNGDYAFLELPPGNYSCRFELTTDWAPNIPADGTSPIDLGPGDSQVRHFGICPVCTCDDFEIILQSEPGMGDTAFLFLTVAVDNPYCLERYEITLDSGEIVGMDQLSEDWEAEIINANTATLFQNKSKPCHDCVPYVKIRGRILIDRGIREKGIKATVRLIGDGNQPPEPICVDSIIIEHPSKYKQFTCCPEGSTLGAELVVNGEFYVVQSPATDYSFLPYPNLPGEIAIVNHVISPFWLQTSKQVGPFDHFLAVNGSTTPGLAVWKQQVSGLLEGESYIFCGLFNNLFRTSQNAPDPVLELVIQDDISLFNWSSGLIPLPEIPDVWEQFSLSWTVPATPASSYTLKIISHGTNPFGNDFGVDCISFRQCIAPPQDTCCKDLEAFCADLETGIVFSYDSCKVTMDLSALPPCYLIEWVDWGQGPEYGPWTSSTFPPPMHTFSGNGTYPISYLAIAYNDSNFICREKVMEDTITVLCNPCLCNDPMMTLNLNGVDYGLPCAKGAPLLQLPCPSGDVIISGFFGCETASGELCDETVVNYMLSGPNGFINSGSTTPFPNFIYPASLISAPGTYSLMLSTLCPGQTDSCMCTLQWLQQDCDTCYCGGFTDMFVRTPQGAMNMAVACGDAPLTIPCPEPGKGFHLTGVFQCAGGGCPPDHQIDWTLVHQSTGTTFTGGFLDNDPYFGIHILPTYISQPGLYTLTMTGYCNGDTCECVIQFIIDCPDLCPCDIADIIALSNNVNQGFVVALANKSCKACFSPLALSDCETVEWFVNTSSGTLLAGTSIGSQTLCYTFPFAGTYPITMVVTRLKPDGTICEVFTYSKTITVSCLKGPICADSVFPNPGFGEGAIAGNMTMGGEAPGWLGEGEYPTVLEGVDGSDDAWSVMVTGCYFSSDRLFSKMPSCAGKNEAGTLTLRMRSPGDPIPGADIKVGRKPPGGTKLTIALDDGAPKDPCKGPQKEQDCYYLAEIMDFLPVEDDDWYDVYIPYDLSKWVPTDSCGDGDAGVPVRLNIRLSNMLSNDQGDGKVRDAVIIDQVCMDGKLVNIQQPVPLSGMRLFPNPNAGSFTLELPQPATPGMSIRITGLTGQVLLHQAAEAGRQVHTIDLSAHSSGMYFVQVWSEGRIVRVARFVKQ
jgi:hypothetical protein